MPINETIKNNITIYVCFIFFSERKLLIHKTVLKIKTELIKRVDQTTLVSVIASCSFTVTNIEHPKAQLMTYSSKK